MKIKHRVDFRIRPFQDYTGLWKDELKDWVPDAIFDAHVHMGPPGISAEISRERRKEPMTTFTSFTREEADAWYENLYRGKKIAGLFAFGFPLREINITAANDYIANLMQKEPRVKGFIISDPKDTDRTIRQFYSVLGKGTKFSGVKPYADLLGKSNYDTTMEEILPEEILKFMDKERLLLMLHTTGLGMSVPENQNFVRKIVKKYAHIKVILAHLGRFLEPKQFFDFLDSGILELPGIFLEMSSGTSVEVYERLLGREEIRTRLIFGSDIPFGLITGMEYWSEETGPTFIARDEYPWSDAELNRRLEDRRRYLTYNTYHVIKSFKDAVEKLKIPEEKLNRVRKDVFLNNCLRLLEP
ncbi:MAG: hypothetical protein V2A65_11060 [Candidatus Omnitrophota bacterium]